MKFIDLKSRHQLIGNKINARVQQVMDHGQFILGPEVREVEEKLAQYTGSKHCVTVSSGTDSLLIALMSLGVRAGDEVITVPYTWISTAEVISLLGAKPVFVDIRQDTWNMDEALLEAAITDRTKAIMPVSIYGQCPDMDAINAIADKYDLPVIEDAAQSFGATYKGKKSCNLSTIGSTSFFPSKPLGCYGDGGALFTNDDELVEKFRWIRVHGQSRKHHHPILGLNGRFDTIQAAILLVVLEVFSEEVKKRQKIGEHYSSRLAKGGLFGIPVVDAESTSVYAQYTIQSKKRSALLENLKGKSIPSVSYYTVPLHLQPVFKELGYLKGDFPVSENLADRCLSLPMSPYLSFEDQEKVINALQELNI
jgi:UDP-2-acetamido-2-deoxy-ribo-hexuluronate aminotransferase